MFGIKEVNDILISAITVDNRGNVSYVPYLFIETAKASESVVSSNTVIAQGGKKQKNLIAWSGENKTTLNFQDALISNKSIEFLIKGTTNLKNSIKTLRKKVAYGKTTVSELIKKDKNIDLTTFLSFLVLDNDYLPWILRTKSSGIILNPNINQIVLQHLMVLNDLFQHPI